ncbi:MAG: rane-bound lytic murein transglycosylase [Betaproteobacteria bacterium]
MLARAHKAALVTLLAACASSPAPTPTSPGSASSPAATAAAPKIPPAAAVQAPKPPAAIPSDSVTKETPAAAAAGATGASFRSASWNDLPGWRDDTIVEAWGAFTASCGPLANRDAWREICATASRITDPSIDAARRFFERAFVPWQVTSSEGADEGLITGYYEPLLRGSRRPTSRYRFPLYAVPDDLLVVDLSEVYPELKGLRLRGKLDGRRVVPYYDRGQIETGQAPLRGKELVWVDDAIELFFLHIQGSGRILLESGETIRVGYADQNGYPYRSIGRLLVERGELALEQASMQGIKSWARAHTEQVAQLLNSNGSYVFFRELPSQAKGPPGSLGVPLTPGRSIAVDARYVPLGAPVYIATTWPNSSRPLNRLTFAQDTGGAIRGAVRADLFWGYGEAAAREAGRMKQRLRMWLLLPQGSIPQNQLTAD